MNTYQETSMNTFSRLAMFALVLGAAACTRAPQQDLKSTKVPAGFTFQTSHSVELHVSGSAGLLTPGTNGLLTVTRMDGKLLYEGMLSSTLAPVINVAVPTKDRALVATLRLADGSMKQQTIPVVGNTAMHTF